MDKTHVVRLLGNGRITIRKNLRDAIGLRSGDLVSITLDHGAMRLTHGSNPAEPQGSPWLKELYDLFAPVREEIAASGMTEDEINAEIDAAVREARAERRRGED